MVVRGLHFSNQLDDDLHHGAVALPLAGQDDGLIVGAESGGGEQDRPVKDELGKAGFVDVEEPLPDACVVNLWLHVDPVLQQPPVRLGHQGEVVGAEVDLCALRPLLGLEAVRSGLDVELLGPVPPAPDGPPPHAGPGRSIPIPRVPHPTAVAPT